MNTDGPRQLIDQLVAHARYEALKDVTSQLGGLLFTLERSASEGQQARWRDEHAAVRARFEAVVPGSADVDHALDELGARLLELQASRRP